MEARAFDFLRLPAVDRADAEDESGPTDRVAASTATTVCAPTTPGFPAGSQCCGEYPLRAHGRAGKEGGMSFVPLDFDVEIDSAFLFGV